MATSNHYPVVIETDEDGVFCPMFKGCRSYGDTVDEAMVNIRERLSCAWKMK